MPPPDLARNAPVLDVLHPVAVGINPLLGMKLNLAIIDHLQGWLRKRFHLDEPLLGEIGFNNHICPLGVTNIVLILLNTHKIAKLFQILENFVASIKSVHTAITKIISHPAIFTDNGENREIVSPGNLIVVGIMRRSNFQRSGSELNVNIIISNNGNMASCNRNNGMSSNQMTIPWIVGVNGNSNVCQNRFRPDGRNGDIFSWMVDQCILYIDQLVATRLHDHLFIGERSLRHRAPVDNTGAPIDQSITIEFDK